ncbi:ribonuclease H-like domain-containing protein, partial [Tanacetum coccineum]
MALIKKFIYDNSSPRPPEELNSENDFEKENSGSTTIHTDISLPECQKPGHLTDEVGRFREESHSKGINLPTKVTDIDKKTKTKPNWTKPSTLWERARDYESNEDLNLKFLRSLPSEWNTHVVVWRNKPDLDTMSFDDLYNNFKIVEQEVKRTASSSSSSSLSSQNMAFVSSPSSTNEVNTAYGVYIVNTQDLEQIHEDDLEEMDLKWQLALLSMRTRRFFQKTSRKITINGSDTAGYDKSKVECFNCHKMGHFARECRGPRNQDNRNRNQDSSRRTVNVEETSSKAMMAIDGAGIDWSYMANDEVPTNIALMAFSDSK